MRIISFSKVRARLHQKNRSIKMCKAQKSIPNTSALEPMQAIKILYEAKVVPSENRHLWSKFDTPPIREQELFGKPTILLLGQYSVGKTSMISYLLSCDYPGADIGPEPTTDIFAHVDYSEKPQTIPGTTLASDNSYQFQSLAMFGDVFLNKLKAARFNSPLLKHISIIDTPGILTGDKQVADRGYNFAQVIKFLSDKVDCIFLLFDANKLDISDEYKQVIQILEGNENKIKIILNKADWVKPRELIHVRGALMWALGKIMKCPEVPKVYIGSFWPYWSKTNLLFREAIDDDHEEIINEILDLPNSYHCKRINDIIKRARNLRIHTYLMDEIMRHKVLFTKTSMAVETETVPEKLLQIYKAIAQKRRIVLNDFPDPVIFHEKAKKTYAKEWRRIDSKLEKLLDSFLFEDVSTIVKAAMNEKKIIVNYQIPKKRLQSKDFYELHGYKCSKRENISNNTNSKEDDKIIMKKDNKKGISDTQMSNKNSEKSKKKKFSSKKSDVESASDISDKDDDDDNDDDGDRSSKTSTKKNHSESSI